MEKLEVGMFIRDTRDGKIYKLTDFGLEFRPQKKTYDFEKASHNIINLIEAGDYVNGGKVSRIEKNYIVINEIWAGRELLENKDIKTIVTKEQFENNCYKIEN